MALFTASTIPWTSAVTQIADSVGASADPEMTQRAHLSLRASFQYFGTKAKWNYLRTEAAPVRVFAPFAVTGITASGGSVSASVPAGHGFQPDDIILGSGFIAGNRISATGASTIGFFAAITGFTGTSVVSASAIRDSYDLPSDWRASYSVRLLSSRRTLRYVGRRVYDRASVNDNETSTPEWYDLFNAFGRSKIRLLRPPSADDVLVHRYQRRMFLASASGLSTAIDIPEDYEQYPIAWAKWHFMTDKNQERAEQGSTWLSLAQEGLKTMIADEQNLPDEDLAFLPSYGMMGYPNDRSTRDIDWSY
jgi:hypothetical protein